MWSRTTRLWILVLYDLQGLGSLTTIWRHLSDIWDRLLLEALFLFPLAFSPLLALWCGWMSYSSLHPKVLWWNRPPHMTVWLGSVYIALCLLQHLLLPSSILHAEVVSCSEASYTPQGCAFPRFTGFLGSIWSIPYSSLSHAVLSPSAALYAAV